MKVIDAIAHILKQEGVEYLSCYPVHPLVEAASAVGIRPIVCRQERVGVGIADGYSRATNGRKLGVFVMQAGPGSENAYSGVATAFSDSTPLLLLPLGYPHQQSQWPRYFNSRRAFDEVTKSAEQLTAADEIVAALRRALSRAKNGRPGPALLELPADLCNDEAPVDVDRYRTVKAARAQGDPRDVDAAAAALVAATAPVIQAGQGVLYAEATDELRELAELLQAPVTTTLLGKSAFPEGHGLSLGTAAGAHGRAVDHFLAKADVVLGVGTSFGRHGIANVPIPPGKTLVQVTNDEADLNRHYHIDYPILGDAKLALAQLVEAVRDRLGGRPPKGDGSVEGEIKRVKSAWLEQWLPKLASKEVPINPYRVVWELGRVLDPGQTIMTHDSGSPRDEMVPFYKSAGPRSYLGWGKSHGLGTGLGLAIGAKLAAPDKTVVNWMGDAAFGMVGLDFETAVRCRIPIITIVSNNFTMAVELPRMQLSTERYRTTDISGNYADLARALGGHGERIEDPEQVGSAIQRAVDITRTDSKPVLLEFITSKETNYSRG